MVDLKGKIHAEEIGRMEFRAPDRKTFALIRSGSSSFAGWL